MDIRDRLEEALDFLLCDAEQLTEDVEARERSAPRQSHRADPTKRRGSSKKRKREADITDEDFDKRLSKLVQAARSGGGMPRGDQYRLLHTPQIQPPPGAPNVSCYQQPSFKSYQHNIRLSSKLFCLGMLPSELTRG